MEFLFYFFNSRLCNFLIEPLSFIVEGCSIYKVIILLNECFILGKLPFEYLCIEYKPFIYIGNNQMFYFRIFMCNTFS